MPQFEKSQWVKIKTGQTNPNAKGSLLRLEVSKPEDMDSAYFSFARMIKNQKTGNMFNKGFLGGLTADEVEQLIILLPAYLEEMKKVLSGSYAIESEPEEDPLADGPEDDVPF